MTIHRFGQSLDIRLSPAAERTLAQRDCPLSVEMELFLSCLIRKRVRFVEGGEPDAIVVSDRLRVRFCR